MSMAESARAVTQAIARTIEHPQQDPEWKEVAEDFWHFKSGDRFYGWVSTDGTLGFICSAVEMAGNAKSRRSKGPCNSIEHGKQLVARSVSRWRKEGRLAPLVAG